MSIVPCQKTGMDRPKSVPTRATWSIGAVPLYGGEDARGHAEDEGEGDGEKRQLEGDGQALEDEAHHRLARAPRGAEVAVGEPADPRQILGVPRLVETEEALELLDHLLAHHRVGADHLLDHRARHQAQHEKDERRSARPG